MKKELIKGRVVIRLLAGGLGLLFLGAGLVKAVDIHLFMTQMRAYGVISHPVLLLISSWGMIALQCTLGMALIVYYRPKWTLTTAFFLWLILLGGTVWAWTRGSTDECGCYGSWLKITPGQAAIENAIFLFLTVMALIKAPFRSGQKELPKIAAISTTLVISLVLPVFFGASVSEITQAGYGMNKIDLGEVKLRGLENLDFGSGTYLLLLMSTDCHHCLELLPEFEALAEKPDMPEMAALCLNEEDQRRRFVEEFQPLFPICRVSDDLFWKLLGNGDIPRLLLVRRGKIEKTWDQTVPEPGMILNR